MKLVVAVHIEGTQANAAAAAFDAWDVAEPIKTYVSPIAHVDTRSGAAWCRGAGDR